MLALIIKTNSMSAVKISVGHMVGVYSNNGMEKTGMWSTLKKMSFRSSLGFILAVHSVVAPCMW